MADKRITLESERMGEDVAREYTREVYRQYKEIGDKLERIKAQWRAYADKQAPGRKLELVGLTVGLPESSTSILSGVEMETAALVDAAGGSEYVTVKAAGLALLSQADRDRLTVTTYGKRRVSIR